MKNVNYANEIEAKCLKAFDDCPFTIDDIAMGKSLGWSDDDFLFEAARRICQNVENEFVKAMYDWMNGHKLNITKKQAEEKNAYFKNILAYLQVRSTFYITKVVNWLAFANDDPTIALNTGYPFDSDLCVWAEKYKK